MEWIFIDIGGPVIDDGIWKQYLDLLLIEVMLAVNIEVTGDEFASVRKRATESKASRPTVIAISEFARSEDEAVRLFGEAYERLRVNFERGVDLPRFLAENAYEGLTRLKESYRLATLSNNVSKVRYLLGISGVSRFFDRHFISEEVGAAKPDEAIFKAALRGAGIAPHLGMMVGDRPDNDIDPARRLGMKTALIRPVNNKVINVNADIICSDLLELMGFL